MAITTTTVAAAPSAVIGAGGPVRSVQWGAIILGALGATAISMVLLTFGAGLGLSAASAQPYAGASGKAIAVISALYVAITMVAAFGAGGYVTGRMRLPATQELAEHEFRDGAHGFAVWALAIVIGGIVAVSGISGAVKTAVQATAAVGGAAAAGAASNPALGQAALSMSPTDYAIDRLMAPVPVAAGAAPAAGAPAAGPAPTRADLAGPMTRVFAASLKSGQLEARDRTMLVQMVMQRTGMPQAEAEKRVDEAYGELKAAEQKARDAVDAARKAALITAFAAAATLLLGCAAACAGATAGAKHRVENTEVMFFGSRRFW
ncbi:hypothetical protein BH10PSE7_BH10PSE7_44810 [soil metagenome]